MIEKLSYLTLELKTKAFLDMTLFTVFSIPKKIKETNSSINPYAFIPVQGSEQTGSCHNFTTQKSIGAANQLEKLLF